jgi:hypothetical protein
MLALKLVTLAEVVPVCYILYDSKYNAVRNLDEAILAVKPLYRYLQRLCACHYKHPGKALNQRPLEYDSIL